MINMRRKWISGYSPGKKVHFDKDHLLNHSLATGEYNVTVNITAERALLRLREKLQGTELGHPTSIEHQVGTLIQQAIDPANLCKLFVGWQPYL